MKVLAVVLVGVAFAVGSVVVWRRWRYRAWAVKPYPQQVAEWYEQDAYGDEPVIVPLKLPPVEPLQARSAEEEEAHRENVRQFVGRRNKQSG